MKSSINKYKRINNNILYKMINLFQVVKKNKNKIIIYN